MPHSKNEARRAAGRLFLIGGAETRGPDGDILAGTTFGTVLGTRLRSGKLVAVTDATVHVLAPGYGFDLTTLRPILPGTDRPMPPPRRAEG